MKVIVRLYSMLLIVFASSTVLATDFPPSAEDPVVDGAFSSTQEYKNANKVLDDLGVGYFYKQHRSNWSVGGTTYQNTITFFDLHYFVDSGYGQLDKYDLNMFDYKWGNTQVTTWVFLPGDHPDASDNLWLNLVGLGNYSTLNDDGGFLVRLNNDPTTDRLWLPGYPQPGDPSWNFADYYGVFAYGKFNNSAYTNSYSSVSDPREIYEWSITMNHVGDGIPGGGGVDNPPAPEICAPVWEEQTKFKKVADWKPKMGGHGVLGGEGYVPDGTEWVFMGFDNSMHPVPIIIPTLTVYKNSDDGSITIIGTGWPSGNNQPLVITDAAGNHVDLQVSIGSSGTFTMKVTAGVLGLGTPGPVVVTVGGNMTITISGTSINVIVAEHVVPTLSQWGIIIFTLLLLAVGMVFVQRRQFAVAGVGAVAVNANPSLFERSLYIKVLGVVLLLAVTCLALSYWYFGTLSKTDSFGTLASSGIVAYMVHLWLLMRKK